MFCLTTALNTLSANHAKCQACHINRGVLSADSDLQGFQDPHTKTLQKWTDCRFETKLISFAKVIF